MICYIHERGLFNVHNDIPAERASKLSMGVMGAGYSQVKCKYTCESGLDPFISKSAIHITSTHDNNIYQWCPIGSGNNPEIWRVSV